MLYEDSDFGKDMTTGLKKGLGAKAGAIVATESYQPTDTSIESQMSTLHASGANVLVLNVTPQYAILAYLAAHKFGWHPRIYISSVCISPNVMDIVRANAAAEANGSRSIAFVKDPTDKVWAKDPIVALYRSILKRYAPAAKPEDVYNFYGMGVAYTMVDALKQAGKNPTRASLLTGGHAPERGQPVHAAGNQDHHDAHRLLPDLEGAASALRPHPLGRRGAARFCARVNRRSSTVPGR